MNQLLKIKYNSQYGNNLDDAETQRSIISIQLIAHNFESLNQPKPTAVYHIYIEVDSNSKLATSDLGELGPDPFQVVTIISTSTVDMNLDK